MTSKLPPDFKALARRAARTRKVLWIIGALATLAAFILYMSWPALLRMKVEHMRESAAVRLLKYTAPAGLIVYNDDNAAGNKLIAQGGYEKEGATAWRGAFYVAPPLAADGAAVPRDARNHGAVFLHGASDGKQRLLILVDISRQYAEDGRWIMLEPHVYRRVRGVDELPPFAWQEVGAAHPLTISLRPNDNLLLHAGQVDPKDPNHFTIDGMVNGTSPFICDGWFDPSTDTVRLVGRRGSEVELSPLARPGD